MSNETAFTATKIAFAVANPFNLNAHASKMIPMMYIPKLVQNSIDIIGSHLSAHFFRTISHKVAKDQPTKMRINGEDRIYANIRSGVKMTILKNMNF